MALRLWRRPRSTDLGRPGKPIRVRHQSRGHAWSRRPCEGSPTATVTDPLGYATLYAFDSYGRLIKQVEANGATTTWTRDGAGRVTEIKDPLGRSTAFERDTKGYVTQETFPDAETQHWSYDSTYHGVTSFTDERGNTTIYVYDPATGHLQSTTDALLNQTSYAYSLTTGLLETSTDPQGKVTSFVYDTYRRQTQAKTTYSLTVLAQTDTAYDSWGNPSSDIDALGLSTAYLFDAMGRKTFEQVGTNGAQTWVYDDSGLVTETQNQNLHRTQLIYDESGRGIVASTVEGAGTQQARTTLYTFDVSGRTQAVRQPNGYWHTFLLDAVGQALTDTDPLGGVRRNVYDLAGQLTDTWDQLGFHSSSYYNGCGWVTASVDPTGYVVSFSFEPNGLSTGWTDSEGRGQSATYDALNRVDITADGNGNTTDTDYWPDGRVKQITDELGAVTTFDVNFLDRTETRIEAYGVAGLQRTITSYFNQVGFVTEVENGLGRSTYYEDNGLHQVWKVRDDHYMRKATNEYDGLGQPKKVKDALNDDTQEEYDGLERPTAAIDADGYKTQVISDAMGAKVAEIDGLGHATKYVNDRLGRQIAIVDANGGVVRKEYDALYLRLIVDPVGNKTRYANDPDGRVIKEVDPLGHATTYERDAAGRVTKTTDRLNGIREFGYDLNDNKTSETWKVGTTTIDSFSWTYNAKNEMLTAMEGTSGYTFTFDELGRPKTQTDPNGFTITTNYVNASDRIDTVADSAGATRQYVYYDDTSTSVSPDNVKYVTFSGAGLPNLRWDLSYNARDDVTEIKRYADLTGTNLVASSTFQQDANGFLAVIDHRDAAGVLIDYFHYGHDAANRVTSEESKVSGSSSTRAFTYDNINQLLSDGATTRAFDKNGNPTMAGYSIDPGNRIARDADSEYEYDDEGNLIRRTNLTSGETWRFLYNFRNQITTILKSGSPGGAIVWRADETYDALGNRSSETIDADGAGSGAAVTTKFAYDQNGNVWADLDASGAITTRRLYLDAVDALFAKIGSSGDVDFYLTDRQGSVRDVYSSTGTLRKEVDYDGYGKIILDTNAGYVDRYGYTGRELQPESQTQYNRGRWYAIFISRWMSEDPLKFSAGDTNLYRPVGNNVTNHTDPNGQVVPLIAGLAVLGFELYGLYRANRALERHAEIQAIFARPDWTQADAGRVQGLWQAARWDQAWAEVAKTTAESYSIGFAAGIIAPWAGAYLLGRFPLGTTITTSALTVGAIGFTGYQGYQIAGNWSQMDGPARFQAVGQVGAAWGGGLAGAGMGASWVSPRFVQASFLAGALKRGIASFSTEATAGEVAAAFAAPQAAIVSRVKAAPSSPYVTRYDPLFPGRPDPRYSIDTSTFTGGELTSAGGIRNTQEFWEQWLKLLPESLSPGNRFLIANYERLKVSPRIDDAWIRLFPEHSGFHRDVLVHHHVDFGRYAIPVPGETHVGSGGPWHAR
ncbi:MAG: RHS repeat-associated core domain-containing protein [Gemmataceae bacterium]